jgi:catechol 2,3-dioxygenase-like lactoylglutathione lyase family enzyme
MATSKFDPARSGSGKFDPAHSDSGKFDVGGVLLDQPFKIRRLGHFGINMFRMAEGLRFYKDLLGFKIVDVRREDPAAYPEEYRAFGDLNGYFLRYAHDHHAFVIYNHRFRKATDKRGRFKDGVTINQITWQVGSLEETVTAQAWFKERGERVVRSGRDMPGSNWHVYLMDPDMHQNELYWGIEQIGWSGHSKPRAMHSREFHETPDLPQMNEHMEVDEALQSGVDLLSGYRDSENLPPRYNVQGVLLPRPFKIVKHGPVNLFVADLDAAVRWYVETLGFIPSEEATYQGHRCVFLRNNTEHHSLALFPLALRKVLGLREDSTTMAFGLQLANYRQLLDAVAFLKSNGVTFRELPPELTPGMDHTILAFDPDGGAVQLYWSMEQIGWDGKPRPAHLRRPRSIGEWPQTLAPNSDSFTGEPLLGPWT